MEKRNDIRRSRVRPCTWIWLLLLALSFTTYGIGKMGLGGTSVMLAVLVITFIKSELVASYFMGLRNTSLLWRGIMASYLIIVGGMIAVAYLISVK
jgi:cytochrome c oxidase subunit IV